MVELKKFRGIGFSERLNPLDNVLTLPFDEIDPWLKKDYLGRSEYNFVRINLPDKHKYSLKTINDWLDKGILRIDVSPHIYPYIQEFLLNNKKFTRKGFFSIISVDPDYRDILPHENIFHGPRDERLELLKKVGYDIEPVFFLYNDGGRCDFLYDFSRMVLWGEEPRGIKNFLYESDGDPEVCNSMKFVIADGHHRYSAAAEYFKEKGRGKYVMGVFVNVNDPGLVLLPSYKIVKGIAEDFNLRSFEEYFDIENIDGPDTNPGKNRFILLYKNKYYKLILKNNPLDNYSKLYRELDAVIFSELIIKKIIKIDYSYENVKTFHSLNDLTENLNGSMAFIFEPIRPIDVWNVALNGEKLPQKSTYFYPKLISGLRMYKKD